MSVHEIRKRETADSAYKGIIRPETLVVVNGGFFGYNHSGDETPIGLVRQGGKKKVALIEWSYGGVLVSDRVGGGKN